MSIRRMSTAAATLIAAGALAVPSVTLAHKGGQPSSKTPCPTHKHHGKHKGSTHGKKKGSTRGKKCSK